MQLGSWTLLRTACQVGIANQWQPFIAESSQAATGCWQPNASTNSVSMHQGSDTQPSEMRQQQLLPPNRARILVLAGLCMQGPGHVQNADCSPSTIVRMPKDLLAFNALLLPWRQKEPRSGLCRSVVRLLPSSRKGSESGQHLCIIAGHVSQAAGRVQQSC